MLKNGWKKKAVKTSNRESLYIASSDRETIEFAEEFGRQLSGSEIICLSGDLGAGKTTFVKGIASSQNISPEQITSPTYTYLNLIDDFAHFDLYRLKDKGHFLSLGFEEYFESEYIVCIEWPEVIKSLLPMPHYWINLAHFEGKRKIEILCHQN